MLLCQTTIVTKVAGRHADRESRKQPAVVRGLGERRKWIRRRRNCRVNLFWPSSRLLDWLAERWMSDVFGRCHNGTERVRHRRITRSIVENHRLLYTSPPPLTRWVFLLRDATAKCNKCWRSSVRLFIRSFARSWSRTTCVYLPPFPLLPVFFLPVFSLSFSHFPFQKRRSDRVRPWCRFSASSQQCWIF